MITLTGIRRKDKKMSVHKTQRHTSDLNVLMLARGLAGHTLRLIGNEKIFPKRHRWQLTGRISSVAIDLLESLTRANKARLGSDLREKLQDRAQSDIEVLYTLIDLSIETFGIPAGRVEYWTKMMCELQKSLSGWIRSDKERVNKKDCACNVPSVAFA